MGGKAINSQGQNEQVRKQHLGLWKVDKQVVNVT